MLGHEHSGFETTSPIIFKDGDGQYIRLPRLTTAQRDALEVSDGLEIYNTDTEQKETYSYGAWGLSLRSKPPSGGHKIYNIWLNENGTIGYEYETEPEP